MDEVPVGFQPRRQQGTGGQDDRGRRSRDTSHHNVDGRRTQSRSRTLPQLRLRIRRKDGPPTFQPQGRYGLEKSPRPTLETYPTDRWTTLSLVLFTIQQLSELVYKTVRETKHLWLPVLIAIYLLHGIHSLPTPEFGVFHQFTAYDCERPTAVEALKLPSHCLAHKTNDDKHDTKTNLTMTDNQPYQLLQKVTYHEFDAHMCIQSRSKFFYSCMWASHSVVNLTPQTGRQIATGLKFCSQAMHTRMFPTESGELVPLNADGQITYIPKTVKGELNIAENGFATCNGEDVRYHGRILKQTVILQETHFTIKKVKIRCNFDSGELMIVETGTTIPAHLTNPNGFVIDSGTYILPKIMIPCIYQVIKPFLGTPTPTQVKDGLVITSQADQVHVHTHGTLNPPEKCPVQGTYRKTGHPDIVVFEPRDGPSSPETGFDPIDARQISIPNMVTLKIEWTLYKTSKKFGLVHDISQQAECSDLKRLTDGGQDKPELQRSTETLLYAKGEMLYNVWCPRIEVGLDLTIND